jgi:tripartite-type tricarboxylate transporter receptor subunit TctC
MMKSIPAAMKCTALVAALALATAAQSQEPVQAYPSKPVIIVIGNAPGGPTDVETRLYSQKLSQSMGRPFILDFKPGAGTAVGSAYVARAAADGYTLISATGGFTIPLRDQIFDPVKDFAAVSLMSRRPSAFYIYPGLPVKNLTEFVA